MYVLSFYLPPTVKMERNEERKHAIGMIEVRLKNIDNTLATVEMSEDIRKALHEEKEELNVYLKSLKRKTPEEYHEMIEKLQDDYDDETDVEKWRELERKIKATYDEFFEVYPERKVMCWYCGEQGHLLNPQGMCSWCASK